MPLVIGVNYQTAPIDIREKMAIGPEKLPKLLENWKAQAGCEEIVCLSTCNRTEVYARSKNRIQTRRILENIFECYTGDPRLSAHLYYHEQAQAVRHLFSVAAGLESMVRGEHEILAQVKKAYQMAQDGGFTGKMMNVLFQRSLFVGKRVRTETGLGQGAASVGSVAVGMAERIFGGLSDRQILILGAGKMAEVTAKHLLVQNARSILVANRTFDHACELAKRFGGSALPFDEGLRRMEEVDIVISSTGAPHVVITPEHVRAIMDKRKGRALFLIDIAMPRDIDPAVNDIENAYLYNIDDLQNIVNANQAQRNKEAEAAARIVEDEAGQFAKWLRASLSGTRIGLKHKAAPPLVTDNSSPA